MDFGNKRVQDLTQVFNRNYQVNKTNGGSNNAVNQRKEFFNRMYNIKDKESKREEILRSNSVDGQVKALNDRINAMNGSQNRNRMNDFRNNFR